MDYVGTINAIEATVRPMIELGTLAVSCYVAWSTSRNASKINKIEISVDGVLHSLAAANRRADHAEGHMEGQRAEQERQAADPRNGDLR
jgi:hypothetical protein